ncbi:acetyl-CoA C-acetyltransferase [Myxococcota bacterium]|nr:acetyl-CoA C-acetyltransferase [Myxococcota bacterium]
MNQPVIVSAVRTPIGKFNGTLKDVKATVLGSLVVKEAIARAGLTPDQIQEVIMGNVLPAGQGQNPARQAAMGAGVPVNVGALTINKVCGSGLKSIMLAANSIKAEEHEIIVAGGMENMDMAPFLLRNARYGYRMVDSQLVDSMVHDGLWEIYNNYHMGNTGERIAQHYDISREMADALSVESHRKAARAQTGGKFDAEIIPVEIPQRKGAPLLFSKDEGIRPETTMETLGRLRPVFQDQGVVTAGNSSQISDGASAVVVMSEKKAHQLGLKPLARIVGYHTSGVKPEDIMEAPIPTTWELLQKTGFKTSDIDLWEHNEAFATASCAVQKEFSIPDDIFNVHGGAVALGHPIGASGARVLTTLYYAMRDRSAHRGLATLCLGGGNAVSMIIELM